MSRNEIIYLLIFICIPLFIIGIYASPVSNNERYTQNLEENCPDLRELLLDQMLNGKNFVLNNMTTEMREEYYHNQTCLYQSIGAIKDDNSIDLTSYFGFNPFDMRIWPANSPIIGFIQVFGSCFPIESHRTAKESMTKLLICMNANSEMYQCPNNRFEENSYN